MRSINVEITDTDDQPIPFKKGKTLAKLEFQPRIKTKHASEFIINLECQTDAKFNKLLQFDIQYEVAMTELYLPTSFNNVVLPDEMWIETRTLFDIDFITTRIQPGRYTLLQLIEELNTALRDQHISIEQDSVSNKVVFQTRQPVTINISEALSHVLGWYEQVTKQSFKRNSPLKCNDSIPDVNRGFQILYLYCDQLIEEIHLGGVQAPLLDFVIPNFKLDGNHIEVDNPQYSLVKSRLNPLRTLKVEIRDNLARAIKFKEYQQPPQVTLHFRAAVK